MFSDTTVCGICLDEVGLQSLHVLHKCNCSFWRDVSDQLTKKQYTRANRVVCLQCLSKYFQFMIDNGHLYIYCPSFRCMHNNQIESQEIVTLISPAHNAKYQVLLNNKVINEYLAQNDSKIRCPFCDQIFDVNVQPKIDSSDEDTCSVALREEKAPSPAVKCPNCLEEFCATCHHRLTNSEQIHAHNCAELHE